MSNFINGKMKTIKPYVPGEQPKQQKFIKLNTNESPFAPSTKAVEYAKSELEKVGAKVAGIVFNMVDRKSSRYYSYYYGHGYGYGESKSSKK